MRGKWGGVIVAIGVVSGLLEITNALPSNWLWPSVAGLALLGALGRWAQLEWRGHREIPHREMAALAAIRQALPNAAFLADFAASTMLSSAAFPIVQGLDRAHRIVHLDRDQTVSGRDVSSTRRFVGTNVSANYSSRMQIPRFAGSLLGPGQLGPMATQRVGEQDRPLSIAVEGESDRFKMSSLSFVRPLAPGESFELVYKDDWPGGMTLGLDAIFYAEALYFAMGVESLTSVVHFDQPLLHAALYVVDIDAGTCELAPLRITWEGDTSAPTLRWNVERPRANTLYFLLFERQQISS